jgi:hypothetical protein
MDSSKRVNHYRLALIIFANVIKAVAKDLPVNDFHTCPMPKLGPRKELGEDFMERHNRVWWLIQSLHHSSWTTKFDTFLYNNNPLGSKIIGAIPLVHVGLRVKSA